ncbi:MAG: peptidase G2 autoproteolytic cleavage domain-containing protein [Leptospirales bacterium]
MALNDKTKNPGDLIKSQDWNDTVDEVNRLGTDKLNRSGDIIRGDLRVDGELTVTRQLQIGDASHVKAFSETGLGELKIALGRFGIGTMIQLEVKIAGSHADTAGMYHVVCNWNERPSILYQSAGNKMWRFTLFGYRQNEEVKDASGATPTSGAAYLWARWLPADGKPANANNTLHIKVVSVTEFDETDTGVWATAVKYPVSKVLSVHVRSSNVGIGTDAPKSKLEVAGDIRGNNLLVGNSIYRDGSIELSGATPYIDFHHAEGVTDYNMRIINNAPGELTVAGGMLRVTQGKELTPIVGTGSLVIGSDTSLNMGFDNNEIMARKNGLPSPLNLNINEAANSPVIIGTLSVLKNGTIAGAAKVGSLSVTGNVGIGVDVPTSKLEVAGDIELSGKIKSGANTIRDAGGGWLRTYNKTGWVSQTYGGGWYMADSSWIRSYGNKNIFHNKGVMRTDGTLQIGPSGGTLSIANGGDFAYRSNVLFANTSGDVGIGTTGPKGKLHIRNADGADVYSGLRFYPADASSAGRNSYHRITGFRKSGLWISGSANGTAHTKSNILLKDEGIFFGTSDGTTDPEANLKLSILNNGNVGIGTEALEGKLTINSGNGSWIFLKQNRATSGGGGFSIHNPWRNNDPVDRNRFEIAYKSNTGVWKWSLLQVRADGSVYAGSTHVTSDRSKKKDILPIKKALDDLIKLKPVSFSWKNSGLAKKEELGFIAQDVEQIYPELIGDNGYGVKHLNYNGLMAPVVQSIKEQQTQIELLTTQNYEQQKLIDSNKPTLQGADFAEYFKSTDGSSIDVGLSVVLEKDKIRKAKKEEVPVGIISNKPVVLGGSHMEWPGKILQDPFGNEILEEYKEEIMAQKTEKVKRERQKVKTKTIEEDVIETVEKTIKGKKVMVEVTKKEKREIDEPQFKEVEIYDEKTKEIIRTEQVPIMETFEVEELVYDENGGPVMVGTGKFEKKTRPKLNPKYDPKREYVPRDQRPEWNVVGLVGQIPLRKGQPTAPGWVKMKDLDKDVELWLVK